MHNAEGSEGSQQGGSSGSHWTRVGSCKVRRDRGIEVFVPEHGQWRQHSVGTDRRAALRLHCGASCTMNGWAMWRIFLDHLRTQVGHESKIAEVGFCEGWTPLCDWLREAQVDHEVDWPSVCTTLKALSKVDPAEVRGLLPVMHVGTRRIINRPVISKAAESERLMASEVADDPGVRMVEAFTASLRTAYNPAVAILDSFVHGTGFIVRQFGVQCYLRKAAQVALAPMAQALS